jgi:Transposase DDE domain
MKELELIALYYYLCECNDKLLCAYNQKFSPNSAPSNEKLTDVELLTIYLYCRRYENKHGKSEIYDYAKRYLKSWFPDLPAYANFNARVNNLAPSLPYLVEYMLEEIQISENHNIDPKVSVMDSLPIMLCSGKRQGKVAPELSEKSYCATKGVYYFGLKIHAIAFRRKNKLPIPEYLLLTSAAGNDLEAVRHLLPQLQNRAFFADKAYSDAKTNENLSKNCNSYIYTPVKLIKGESEHTRQFKKAADDLFSTAVSRIRQPIESLFNWIIQKTDIQNASKVRSTKGLLLHVYGSMATALFFWLF